jgi:hypothetical protein
MQLYVQQELYGRMQRFHLMNDACITDTNNAQSMCRCGHVPMSLYETMELHRMRQQLDLAHTRLAELINKCVFCNFHLFFLLVCSHDKVPERAKHLTDILLQQNKVLSEELAEIKSALLSFRSDEFRHPSTPSTPVKNGDIEKRLEQDLCRIQLCRTQKICMA